VENDTAESEKILLVDDNTTNLQVLLQTLDDLNCRLLVAKDGASALAIAAKAQPALVLLDVIMPRMDGYEVCRRLKENPLTRDAAVLFLSALDETRDKLRGFKLGAVDYITKPFQADEIIARVRTHLKIHRLQVVVQERNRALKATNQHILEAIGEGVYGLDPTGHITFANPKALSLTGFPLEEVLGRSIHQLHLHHSTDGAPLSGSGGSIHDTLAQAKSSHSDTEIFWRRNNTAFPVELTSTPIRENGRMTGAVVAFRDITERKRQEQALRQALTEVRQLKEKLQAENTYLREEIKTDHNFEEIIGNSPALIKLLKQVEQVAPLDTTVLVQGESGTGKELIARAIHSRSPRRERPLIKVNCGAISPNLVESALFGHEKGAFTGAVKAREGYFQLADGGTLFLDECGEIPLETQVKLLRVLQEKEIEPVGGSHVAKVDVRVIAATNRDLREMVDEGIFRLDLYYRLNVFPLTVPPLRERVDDISALADFFLQKFARKSNRFLTGVSGDSLTLLRRYPWPGNIRELQNVIERASILAKGPSVEIESSLLPEQALAAEPDAGLRTLAENEYQHIVTALENTHWVVDGKKGAAAILDMPASTLRSRMKKLGIRRPSSR
jgi:PAS domain S-box-containing protein